ncbi:MAG: LytR C-terminal domain-containing protein [Gemmatimonadaceae bacterium]
MKIGRWLLLALVLAGAGLFAWRQFGPSIGPGISARNDAPGLMVAPGVRIKVEVLNATPVRGLARRATIYLRDRGFDVVAIGTSTEARAKTLVLDRSGNPAFAALVGRAFGAPVEQRRDSSRYLDVTVLVGSDWRPPRLPFYP